MKRWLLIFSLTLSLILLGIGGWKFYQYWNENDQSDTLYSSLEVYVSSRNPHCQRKTNPHRRFRKQQLRGQKLILLRSSRPTPILLAGSTAKAPLSIIRLSRGLIIPIT